jgi:hypothetical protein
VRRQQAQLCRWRGSKRLAVWVQRCEKTARSALQVARQQTAGSVGSEVREYSKVSFGDGAAADGWQCGFKCVRRQQGQLCRWRGSRQLAMWVQKCEKTARSASEMVRQQTAGFRCVRRQQGQLWRWCGSRRLAVWVQRSEKTARSALQVAQQPTAGSVGSLVLKDSKVSFAGGAAADGWVQRCQKTARSALEMVRQQMAGIGGSEE